MSLENIINRIIEDARKEAERILREAEERRVAELEAARNEYLARAEEIKEKARVEAEQIKIRTDARLKLEETKKMAAFESELVDTVISEAIESLKNSKKELLKKIFFKLITNSGAKGNEKIRVCQEFRNVFTTDFISELNKVFGGGKLVLEEEPALESDLELVGKNYFIKINLSYIFEENRTKILNLILKKLEPANG